MQLLKSLKMGFFCHFGRIEIKLRKCTAKNALNSVAENDLFLPTPSPEIGIRQSDHSRQKRGISIRNRSISDRNKSGICNKYGKNPSIPSRNELMISLRFRFCSTSPKMKATGGMICVYLPNGHEMHIPAPIGFQRFFIKPKNSTNIDGSSS